MATKGQGSRSGQSKSGQAGGSKGSAKTGQHGGSQSSDRNK